MQKKRVLILCTGNACRSQMAEAMLKHMGGDRFEVFSAGSDPAGYIHPLAITAMQRLGIPMIEPRSKSWDEFEGIPLDIVITVCDSAASTPCPRWGGDAIRTNWPMPDPSFHIGSENERVEFAVTVANRLKTKIQSLIELDFSLDRSEIQSRLDFLGVSDINEQHQKFMRLAIQEAVEALEHDDVPVGAVVVHGNRVIGRGHNERERLQDPTAHAEMIALTAASEYLESWRLDDCTMYVTLEPCTMCAGALVLARIKTLVFGAADPKAGACGSVFTVSDDARLNHRIETIGGISEFECGDLLRTFFQKKRSSST